MICFSKCDQIRKKFQIWSHLLKKSLTENFIFCVVKLKKHMRKGNFGLISNSNKENGTLLLSKEKLSSLVKHPNGQKAL